MNHLEELMSLCECGVYVYINAHRTYYESVADDLDDVIDEIDNDVWLKMVELDTIVNIDFYPDTPISFVSVYHYDLNSALLLALDYFRRRGL